MKKLTILILVILIGWNSYLTFLITSKSNQTIYRPIIDQSVSRITSDLTKLIANSEPKVVAVSSIKNGNVIGTGSGVIYQQEDDEVLIITNHHVVDKGMAFRVRFANGEEIEATKVGTDALTDIAVLSVKVDFLTEAFRIGDSSLTSVGEYVVAIGSPLGWEFQGTATFGIISGKDRVIPVDLNGDGIDDWDSLVMQTDAAINPGNSGGALVNLAGELIGITSMKISSYNVEGMGFAIPVNEIISIVEQIKENGAVKRPMLGITAVGISDMSNLEKSYYGIELSQTTGIFILTVSPGSAAEKAGIKPGDILTKMDTVTILDYKQFRLELYKKDINQRVVIEIIRERQKRTVEAVLSST